MSSATSLNEDPVSFLWHFPRSSRERAEVRGATHNSINGKLYFRTVSLREKHTQLNVVYCGEVNIPSKSEIKPQSAWSAKRKTRPPFSQ